MKLDGLVQCRISTMIERVSRTSIKGTEGRKKMEGEKRCPHATSTVLPIIPTRHTQLDRVFEEDELFWKRKRNSYVRIEGLDFVNS